MGSVERPRRVVVPPGTSVEHGIARTVAPYTPGPAATRALYATRTPELLGRLRRLDAAVDDASVRDIAAWLHEEYVVRGALVPVGFVAPCLLGAPYVDHRLGLDGRILGHCAAHDVMPPPFDGARMLARSDAYAFVEVYADGLVLPVLPDGTVVRP
ncbi:hypothetical protein PV755_27690 [Streptomyces caniscabiei]|uniref:Uncharacterized protein n=1 Tax=Streptomyces caniscabiei TaxID=2746961 RepID=A0A927LB38_9ACTN|nr:hypothetical protein [Streptomyces caniscabiei]MBD9727449.1 hypothetical protein [Streptomyces caniscabiei]MDX3512663.1 hypothetical protein [Streptomyces caniscabiei]MDX3722188.1 hypothetical protein [Streptomyces caniscabiei]WEO28830.1 hypothetical protein IHE65_39805 [Streptomyces caniscabiei]